MLLWRGSVLRSGVLVLLLRVCVLLWGGGGAVCGFGGLGFAIKVPCPGRTPCFCPGGSGRPVSPSGL
ncbi:hypothetical protein PR002_g26006 [Phytophthora rubi]|uniref:Uncharacterized protein n=1 Tax=Phytophthora rubi TaxID=129364 RepID=A0A6A3HWM8_9STRA|nr:hypothetical protein PR002_g26006 [Phytophthora rubi]